MTVKLYEAPKHTFVISSRSEPAPTCRCSIIPPHIGKKLADGHPDAELRSTYEHNHAISSRIRQHRAAIAPALASKGEVTVYDARHSKSFSKMKKVDPAKTSDTNAKEAFKYGVATRDFFQNVLGRNSIDNKGMGIKMVVHYRRDYDNAFWDGEKMVFGDGDPRGSRQVFTRFTIDSDITAHELAHGVTQYAVEGDGLIYEGQSGALNEHLSDVAGIQVKLYINKTESKDSNWQIGEYVLVDIGGKPYALRNMLKPGTGYTDHPLLGTDPQPGHMANYLVTTEDNGGVHYNSGIPNRAFALTALELGGNAWDVAGKVWYATYPLLKPTDGFKAMADKSVQVAIDKFGGIDGAAHRAVTRSWREVGVLK